MMCMFLTGRKVLQKSQRNFSSKTRSIGKHFLISKKGRIQTRCRICRCNICSRCCRKKCGENGWCFRRRDRFSGSFHDGWSVEFRRKGATQIGGVALQRRDMASQYPGNFLQSGRRKHTGSFSGPENSISVLVFFTPSSRISPHQEMRHPSFSFKNRHTITYSLQEKNIVVTG